MELSIFPDEIILEILRHCPEHYNILSLREVSKKFDHIVINTPSLMHNVTFVIKSIDSLSQMLESTGGSQYQSIYFKYYYEISDYFLCMLDKFSGIKSLEFEGCVIRRKLFIKILEAISNLETITINNTRLIKTIFDPDVLPQLPELKSLHFRKSDIDFLKLFAHAKLEVLSIEFPEHFPLQIMQTDLNTLLRYQPKLKTLDYKDGNQISDLLLTTIVKDMRNLRELSLEIDREDMNNIRNLGLKNASVRYLTIYCNTTDEGFKAALDFFKQIRVLKIEWSGYITASSIAQLQQQTPNLDSLHITGCTENYFDHLQLHNLKNLHLSYGTRTLVEWRRLANSNPSIEKLVIKYEPITTDAFETICLMFKSLKHLEISYEPSLLAVAILDFVCSPMFPAQIRYLKLVPLTPDSENTLKLNERQRNILNTNFGFQLFL